MPNRKGRAKDSPVPKLSERELSVLRGVVAGQTNSAIGNTLGLSYETIKTYVTRLRTKLGVPTKTALGVYAVKHQLVEV